MPCLSEAGHVFFICFYDVLCVCRSYDLCDFHYYICCHLASVRVSIDPLSMYDANNPGDTCSPVVAPQPSVPHSTHTCHLYHSSLLLSIHGAGWVPLCAHIQVWMDELKHISVLMPLKRYTTEPKQKTTFEFSRSNIYFTAYLRFGCEKNPQSQR